MTQKIESRSFPSENRSGVAATPHQVAFLLDRIAVFRQPLDFDVAVQLSKDPPREWQSGADEGRPRDNARLSAARRWNGGLRSGIAGPDVLAQCTAKQFIDFAGMPVHVKG